MLKLKPFFAVYRIKSNQLITAMKAELIQSAATEGKACTTYDISDREKQIIALIRQGLTSTKISSALYISHHTVRTHRKNIMRKLNVNNIQQLVVFAISNAI